MNKPTLTVEQAVSDFLSDMESDNSISDASVRDYQYPLKDFTEFVEQRGVETVDDIDPYLFKQWKIERQGEVKAPTVKNNLCALRKLIKWCEQSGLLPTNTHDMIEVRALNEKDAVNTTMIEPKHAKALIEYLEKYEYATRQHATILLMFHTCLRMGAVVSLDMEDVTQDKRDNTYYLDVQHRPESETPLKNKAKGEREVNISDDVAEVLIDYIDGHREDVQDEYGRRPLFTTKHGRVSRTRLRVDTYKWSRPCAYGRNCPVEGVDPETCDAAQYVRKSSKCPESVSTHPFRRAAITNFLDNEFPKELLSDRANVSVPILEKHYDRQKEETKRRQRRKYLDF